MNIIFSFFFFFQAEDGIRDYKVTAVQTCALPISFQFLTETIAVLGDATNEAELEMVDLSDSSRMRDADRIISIRPAGVGPDRGRSARPGQRVSEVVYGRERPAARAVPRHAGR